MKKQALLQLSLSKHSSPSRRFPAVVAAGGDDIDLLDLILADIADPEGASQGVEGHAQGLRKP